MFLTELQAGGFKKGKRCSMHKERVIIPTIAPKKIRKQFNKCVEIVESCSMENTGPRSAPDINIVPFGCPTCPIMNECKNFWDNNVVTATSPKTFEIIIPQLYQIRESKYKELEKCG